MKNLISSKLPSNKKEKKELELLEEKYYLDYIGDDGYVYKHNGKEYYRTNILLQGPKGAPGVRGKDGLIPRIGDNGNWFIGDKDTLVKAQLNTEEYATKQDLQNVEVKILETPDNSGNDGLILSVLNGKTVWINPANGSVVDNVISNTSENPVQNKVIKEYIDNNYARNDGFYETLGAGTALNLQGNTSKDATFTYRTAGGTEDIASGLAIIHNIKGNTVVWNQLVANVSSSTENVYGITRTKIDNHTIRVSGTSERTTTYTLTGTFSITDKHKYYIKINGCPSDCKINSKNSLPIGAQSDIIVSQGSIAYNFGIVVPNGILIDAYIHPYCIDLTLMFGAGNEPSTVEEFDEWLNKNIGKRSYYEYNEGTIINANAETLQTIGFNQWDEEWELGYLDSHGNPLSDNTKIRSKNFIRVFPNTKYYVTVPTNKMGRLALYDCNYNFIDGTNVGWFDINSSREITTPSNAAYCKFYITGTNYNNNICINLSWSGIKNGEYESYWKRNYNLYLNQIQGYDSNDNLVTCFPDGMKRVGDVYDEIIVSEGVTKAIKRVGSIDLGILDWTYTTYHFSGQISDLKSATNISSRLYGLFCEKYVIANEAGVTENAPDKTIKRYTDHRVLIRDTDYGISAADFKTAMNGVMLYYELDTPIEYTLVDFDLPLPYKVDDFGTEEFTNTNLALTPTINIRYGLNAVDTLRRLPTNYVSVESMENFLLQDDDNNTVISEAFAALQARIVALEKMLLDPNTLISLSVKSLDAQDIYICGQPEVITGNGAPTEVPRFIGQRYLDLSNDRVYTAFSLTNSTGDWK